MKKNPLFKKYSVDTSGLLYLKVEKEQIEAVKRNGNAIRYIPNPSTEAQIEAVKQNEYAIQHISNPSPEVQLEAVKQYGNAIQWISNPSTELQIEAVKQNGDAIRFISNPSPEVQTEAVNNLLRQNITDINNYYPNKLNVKTLKCLLNNLIIKDII